MRVIKEYKSTQLSIPEYTQTLYKHTSKYRQWIACLRNYSRFLRFQGQRDISTELNELILDVEHKTTSSKIIKVKTLTHSDYETMLQTLKQEIFDDNNSYWYKVHFMIIAFCLLNGLRISETSSIRKQDIKKEGHNYFLTVVGKGNKERTMVMDTFLIELYLKFVKLIPQKQEYLFVSLRDQKPISREYATRLTHKVFSSISMNYISPHKLRHTFATEAIRAGVPLETIRIILGHSNIATTSLYLHGSIEDQKQAMLKMKEYNTKALS